jgi:hypothetical protein
VAHPLLKDCFSVRKRTTSNLRRTLSMQAKNPNLDDEQDPGLPPRPGEPVPGDVGKKGGEQPEPQGGPTDVPRQKPGVEKGPENAPTI